MKELQDARAFFNGFPGESPALQALTELTPIADCVDQMILDLFKKHSLDADDKQDSILEHLESEENYELAGLVKNEWDSLCILSYEVQAYETARVLINNGMDEEVYFVACNDGMVEYLMVQEGKVSRLSTVGFPRMLEAIKTYLTLSDTGYAIFYPNGMAQETSTYSPFDRHGLVWHEYTKVNGIYSGSKIIAEDED